MEILRHTGDKRNVTGTELVATIGSFDGVHLGHQHLISQIKSYASQHAMRTAVVTFSTPPSLVIGGVRKDLITSLDEKMRLLAQVGVDYLIMLDFTPELSRLSSTQFMEMLNNEFNVKALAVGFNHHFGHDREAGFEDYCRGGKSVGVDVFLAKEYDGAEAPVSSTIVRNLLAQGDMRQAARKLGRPHRLMGTVVHGMANGRKMGYPTANLFSPDYERLTNVAVGVYAVMVHLDDEPAPLMGMANVGYRPTVGANLQLSVEVNIFNFDRDIYDHTMAIDVIERLRDEHHFPSLAALAQQLASDRALALATLTKH